MGKINRSSASSRMGHAVLAFCLLSISRPVLIRAQVTLPVTASPVPTVASVAPPTDAPITTAPVASTIAPVASTFTPTSEPINTDSPTPAPFVTEEPTVAPVTSAPVVSTSAPIASTTTPTPAPIASEPTLAPVTGSPTVAPVTSAPTLAPVTGSPTAAPVKVTTAPTTSAPTTSAPTTSAPTTSAPTRSPTSAPTNSPVEGSQSPTIVPTKSPSKLPTSTPTLEPSASPTTPKPTGTPSVSPSSTPTSSPSTPPKETENPSLSPSSAEPVTTSEPTKAPVASGETSAPTTTVDKTTTGLTVTLNGICVVESPAEWSNSTTNFFAKQYVDSERMNDTTVEVKFTSQQSSCGGRRNTRGLQANSVEVTYEQALAYTTSDSTLTPDEALELPLSTQPQQDEYVATLKELDGYSDLTSVSAISVPPTTAPIIPNPDTGGGVPQWAIIIIIVIGILALVVLFLIVLRKRRATSNAEGYMQDEPTYEQSGLGTNSSGIPGLGDETVETMDYDYAKAYGAMGDASLSEAGGTMGSRAAAQAGEGTIFSDDPTFNEHYDNGHEEVIDIFAPAGKLGVVIDTPNDDAPVVHAVKDSSPIANQVRVGDKLVAVDDEDVRAMTAIKVSKLISKKSTQESRKLTIIRHVQNS